MSPSSRLPARRILPLLACALPLAAPAQAPERAPETHKFFYSPYEQATIDAALAQLGFAKEAAPEGKIVESIHPVRLEVIEVRDPAPRFLNVFHVLTRSYVIERESLLHVGEAYRQTLADETQRNLTGLPQLSLVLVVAAQGSAPGKVRLVIITKDVWSLRLNWNMALTATGLEELSINPSETNFLGTHQTVGLLFDWLPQSSSIGAAYTSPRVGGSHVDLTLDGGVIFNNGTGSREGSFGDLEISYPLWSTQTAWSWGGGVSWADQIVRRYVSGQVSTFRLDAQTDCSHPSALCVPYAYRSDVTDVSGSVTRSFGWSVKHDFSLGFDARVSHFSVDAPGYDPATVQAFQASRVPVSDDRIGPFLQYRTYGTNYLRILDLETLALQEDYTLGPQLYVRLYPLLRALGSSNDVLGLSMGLAHTLAMRDGLLRAGLEWIQEARLSSGELSDASIQATLRVASPRIPLGRFVLDGVLLDRYRNHLNRLSALGGDGRLRGYPSQYFVGSRELSVNAEYRSRPLELFESIQVAGTLFYDVGDAFDVWSDLRLWQTVGGGLRFLLPQLDRVAFRLDVGVPIAPPAGVMPVNFFVTFGQAFPLYGITPRTAATR
jgi:hypothetical protein